MQESPANRNFEQEKLPRDWNNEEKMEWFRNNEKIIRKALSSYQNKYDADDLHQMAYEACLKCFETYDPAKNALLSTYCYRAIKNSINMEIRHAGAKKRNAIIVSIHSRDADDGGDSYQGYENKDSNETDWLHSPQISIADLVERKDMCDLLYRIVRECLTEKEQEIVRLAGRNYTQTEIARHLGCSQAKISNQFKVIRAKIILGFKEHGYEFSWE